MWLVRVFWGTQRRELPAFSLKKPRLSKEREEPYVNNPPPSPIRSPPQPRPHPTPNMASACSPMRSRFMLAAVGSDRERWGSQKLKRRMPKPAPDALEAPPPVPAFVRAQSSQAERGRVGGTAAQAEPGPGQLLVGCESWLSYGSHSPFRKESPPFWGNAFRAWKGQAGTAEWWQ